MGNVTVRLVRLAQCGLPWLGRSGPTMRYGFLRLAQGWLPWRGRSWTAVTVRLFRRAQCGYPCWIKSGHRGIRTFPNVPAWATKGGRRSAHRDSQNLPTGPVRIGVGEPNWTHRSSQTWPTGRLRTAMGDQSRPTGTVRLSRQTQCGLSGGSQVGPSWHSNFFEGPSAVWLRGTEVGPPQTSEFFGGPSAFGGPKWAQRNRQNFSADPVLAAIGTPGVVPPWQSNFFEWPSAGYYVGTEVAPR